MPILRRILAVAALACTAPSLVAGQTAPLATSAAVDTLLLVSGVPNVLAGLSGVVQAQLARAAPALAPERMARAREVLSRHFEGARLYGSVSAALIAQAESGKLVQLYDAFTTGPVAEARKLAAEYRPPLPFDQFVSALSDLPPPQARVELMLRLARAQRAGPLYLTIAEAARGAATAAGRALDGSVPAFRALPDDQVLLVVEQHDQQAVVLFLHRYAPISDELIRSWAERYESDSGQWFASVLTAAVRDAVLTAAEQASEELRSGQREASYEGLAELDSRAILRLYLAGS